MNKFLQRLGSGEILIADGSTGASLQKMGLKPGIPPEDLVLDAPEMVLQLEEAFVAAGADIILTDTFGGSSLMMRKSKYAERTSEINRCPAELARQAASKRAGVLVAGSIGPTGMLIKPYGPLTVEEATTSFAEQVRALAEGGVDLLVIETMFAFE